MKEVTKDMLIGDLLSFNKDVAPILMQTGMHCLGCPSAQSETIGEACLAHGVDADKLVDEINSFISKG